MLSLKFSIQEIIAHCVSSDQIQKPQDAVDLIEQERLNASKLTLDTSYLSRKKQIEAYAQTLVDLQNLLHGLNKKYDRNTIKLALPLLLKFRDNGTLSDDLKHHLDAFLKH
jgi:hypothetical protein